MRISAGVVIVLVLGALVSCASRSQRPAPLRPGAFGPQDRTIATDPMSPVDQSGPITSENLKGSPVAAPAPRGTPPPGQVRAVPNTGNGLSNVVRENMQSPIAAATAPATSQESAPAIGISSGQYMTIGGVVAEVNNTPIYADKVVAQIAHVLAARARETPSRERFRDVARQEIRDQVRRLVNLELEYAAAQRNLDEQDRSFAADLTADWRRHKIAEAQGSEELARKRAAEQGMTLEEMTAEQHRFFMSQIYYNKRLVPRIQVSADDMRRYYDQHVADQFTQRETARFRLIKISVKQVGDRAEARKKIDDLRQRIQGGEDFTAIASTTNDPVLARSGGLLTVQRGAFAEGKVDQAVWETSAGAMTDIIETPDAFYLAKVEEKKTLRVVPFDEESTQLAIKEKLKAEQFNSMREQVLADLRKDAIIRSTDDMMNTAVEIAMQNYSLWSGKS